MTTTYKSISVYPTVGELTLLYLVPVDKQAVISSFWACNQTSSNIIFRLAVVPATDSTPSQQHYRYYDQPLRANRSFTSTTGIALGENDTVWIWASGAASFSLDIAELE